MPPETPPEPPPLPPAQAARRRRAGLWLLVLAGLALGILALGVLGGGSGSADPRAAALLLSEAELGAVLGGGSEGFMRTSPPVDLDAAERLARTASLGRLPLPQSRAVTSHRSRDGHNEEVTQVVLVYDDPAQAEALVASAAPLLESTLGLAASPLALEGASDARAWSAPGYRAASFRQGGLVVLVGSTRADAPSRALRWAEAIRDRAASLPGPRASP